MKIGIVGVVLGVGFVEVVEVGVEIVEVGGISSNCSTFTGSVEVFDETIVIDEGSLTLMLLSKVTNGPVGF